MPNVTHARGPANTKEMIALRDATIRALEQFTADETSWTPEHVEIMRETMATFHDKLDEVFIKHVDGFKRGDLVELKDQTVAKISEFAEGDTVFLFKRNNGSVGRAGVDYIRGHKRT
jgi:hypothetical protein